MKAIVTTYATRTSFPCESVWRLIEILIPCQSKKSWQSKYWSMESKPIWASITIKNLCKGRPQELISIFMITSSLMQVNVNLAGLPALVLPCGFVEGGSTVLPVGFQMIGAAFDEVGVYSFFMKITTFFLFIRSLFFSLRVLLDIELSPSLHVCVSVCEWFIYHVKFVFIRDF